MKDQPKMKSSWASEAILWLRDLSVFGILYLVFTTAGWGHYHIPSSSMEPTLEVGDRVAVSKFSYGYNRYSVPFSPGFLDENRIFASPLKRGEVAVFNIPERDNELLIKRVIGLPGDRIQTKGGRLYINGEMVERTMVREVNYTTYQGEQRRVKEYDETLPGGTVHRIYEVTDNGRRDNAGPFVVPPEHYFMMGDNRDVSADSRELTGFGYVPFAYFIGRAEITTVSFYDCDQGKPVDCPLDVPTGRMFTSIK